MSSELIDLLNAAASDDPSTVVAAGQQILLLTASNDSINRVYERLALVVFNPSNTHLTANGRFVGLIHLKNVLFDSQIWRRLDTSERASVKHLLLGYLESGRENSKKRNSIECIPRIGSCVIELVSRLVHNDWLKEEWSDNLWEQLINCCAWSSLRLGLRAAASYRLPARRRVFVNLIQTILPGLFDLWQNILMELNAENLDCAIRLSHLLYTCLTAPGLQPKSGPFLMDLNALPLVTSIFEQCFLTLDKWHTLNIQSDMNAESIRLIRRLTKLILATTMVSCPEVRGRIVRDLMIQTSGILSKGSAHPKLDAKSVTWLLALIYGLLSSKASDSGAQLRLDSHGSSELHKWLFQSSLTNIAGQAPDSIDTPLFALLYNLICTSFSVSPFEIMGLTSNPEGCMATGGACIALDTEHANVNVNAASIWDVDVQVNDLIRVDLPSLLGLRGSDQQLTCFQPCRQLTELIITLLIRHYKHDTANMLFRLAESMRNEATGPMQYEALMRLIQLVLPYTDPDPAWNTLIDWLISFGFHYVSSNLPLPNDLDEARQSVLLITRTLCLVTRCAMRSSSTGTNQMWESQCTNMLSQLIPYLNAGSQTGIPIGPSSLTLCVRLATAHCVAWCVNQPVFPTQSLTAHLGPLFHGLVQLIYDVSECETRVYLLSVLCGLLESTDVIGDPELAGQMLNLLDQLWRLETQTTALRSSILDAVCLLQTALNSSDDSDIGSQLVQFRSSLQSPVAALVTAALEDEAISGSEALFEPGLRLWCSMVTGSQASWSEAVESLMPILVGRDSTANSSGDVRQVTACRAPLINRLESTEQAEMFFNIAEGYLSLACQAEAQIKLHFLIRWTEPFWSPVLAAASPRTGSTSSTQSNLEYLYSHAASVGGDDDSHQDSESECRLKQLQLLTAWLSVCIDVITSELPLTPSLVGLVVLAARHCLLRAPISAHDDISPRATQMQLGLLARLAHRQDYWPHYLHLLHFLHTNHGIQDTFNSSLCMRTLDWPALDLAQAGPLIEAVLERWLTRADALTERIDRRCYALACLQSLVYCAQSYPLDQGSIEQSEEQLELWALQSTIHARWLEPVINLCIQALFDESRPSANDHLRIYSMHPNVLATDDGLRKHMLSVFSTWQNKVGGESFANALLRCHVDSALIRQLQTQLISPSNAQ